jgi:hypothetical protein
MNPHEEIEAALDEYQTRSRAASATGAQAFARLLRLAEERNSGQITRVVRFLAATYNGQAFPSCSAEHDGNNAYTALMRTGM